MASAVSAASAAPGGIELIALDNGPGIHDLHAAFADGMSSAGTPGNGLGAMRRRLASAPARPAAICARSVA